MIFKLAFSIFCLSLAGNMLVAAADPGLLMIPAALLGWYLADMLSGFVHMYMDYRPCLPGKGFDRLYFYQGSRESKEYQTMFRETMKKVNPFERLVYDFKNHHPRPHALGRRSLERQIFSTLIAGSIPASLLFNLLSWTLIPMPGWVAVAFVVFLLGGTFAQYFHGTLHRTDNPLLIIAMRRLRLLMTPEAHQLHHDTLQRDFSTNCGWSNPAMNRVFAFLYRRQWLRDEGLEPIA